jgi:hypothetical protein
LTRSPETRGGDEQLAHLVDGEADAFGEGVYRARQACIGDGGQGLLDRLANELRTIASIFGWKRVQREQGRDDAYRLAFAEGASNVEHANLRSPCRGRSRT